jgi:hypothetical protein
MLLPDQYDEAEQHFNAENYDKAIKSYLAADKESPDNNHIMMGLLKAYAHKAVSHHEDAQSKPAEDIDSKIDYFQIALKANKNAKAMIAELQKLEPLDPEAKQPKTHPSKLVLPPSDDDEMEYTTKILIFEKTLQKQKARSSEALLDAEQEQTQIIDALRKALALRKEKPEGPIEAYKAYKPYDKYAPYMKKVAKAKSAIEKTAINFYEARGLYYVSKNTFTLATKDFKAAQAIVKSSYQASAGLLAVSAKKQINKKQFESAYATLDDIYKKHPKSKFYKKHIPNVRTQVVNRGLAKAKKLTLTASINDKADAFAIYHELTPIAKPSKALTGKVNVAISKLQDQVATDLTTRAQVLNAKNSFAYSSNIAALLTSAHGFSTKAALPFKQMAYRANQISQQKLALPVFFSVDGRKAKQRANFSGWLNEGINDSVAKMGIQHVKATDPFELPNQGIGLTRRHGFNEQVVPFDQAEVLFYLDLKKHDFVERGRNRPKMKTSKYVSRRYKVDNPEWDVAKDRYEDAKDAYEEAKRLSDLAADKCEREAKRHTGGGLLGMAAGLAAGELCRQGVNAINAEWTDYNDAKRKYENTPRRIEKKEYSRYRYEEYTVQVKGQVVADLYAYDRRNKKKIKLKPINLKVNKKGTIIKKAKRTDTNGIKNGEKNVPVISREIQMKEKSVFKHVRSQMAMFLENHQWQRFCAQGDALTKRRQPHAATDAYAQCIELAPKDAKRSKEIIAANKAIQKYMGFSSDMVAKYGANKSYSNFAKASYELSEQEVSAAEKAATFAFMSRPTIKLNHFDLAQEVAALRNGTKSPSENPLNDIASPIGSGQATQTVSLESPAE